MAWLKGDGPARLIQEVGDPYQKDAIARLASWDPDADYDAATGDIILQAITLGSIVYG